MRTQAQSANSTSNRVDAASFSKHDARFLVLDRRAASIRRKAILTKDYLTDERWGLIASCLPGKEGDPGRHGRDNRLFIEAVFWIVRTGSSWRSLPSKFGRWYTIYTRFHRWMQKGIWADVLNALAADETCEYFFREGEIRYEPAQRRAAEETVATPPAETKELAQSGRERRAPEPSRRATRRARARCARPKSYRRPDKGRRDV